MIAGQIELYLYRELDCVVLHNTNCNMEKSKLLCDYTLYIVEMH